MRLTCPSCEAVYDVPAENLRPGRRTRCARCGAMWVPLLEPAPDEPDDHPPSEQPEATKPATPAPPPLRADTAMDRLAAGAAPRRSIRLLAAWAASVLLLVGALAAVFIWRDGVVSAWPPAARLLGGHPAAPAAPHGAAEHNAPSPQSAHAGPAHAESAHTEPAHAEPAHAAEKPPAH